MKKWQYGLIAILAVILLAFLINYQVRSPEYTSVWKGRQVAMKYGCFNCHGPEGVKGFPNPNSKYSTSPAWQGNTAMMFIHDSTDIREWVMNGHLDGETGDTAALIPMPAYKDIMTEAEFKDLELYLKAVMEIIPIKDNRAQKGYKIAKDMGCFGCHGPYGLGGTVNYGAFKGYIPGWEGEAYADLVRTDDELHGWIMDGEIPRVEENFFYRYFTEDQVIKMPAYKDVLKKDEYDLIVHYIDWLRNQSFL